MPKPNKRTVCIAALTALLIAVAVLCRIGGKLGWPDGGVAWLGVLRSTIYLALFFLWGVSIRRRIIQTQVRRYLTAIAALMVFWVLVRSVKYHIATDPTLVRLLWYLFYLPMLFIPLLAVFVSFSLGKPERFRLPRWTALLYVPTVALLLLVLTNDLHQAVFAFPANAAVWSDHDYGYAPCYWLVVGWEVLCALTALGVMVQKCRVPRSRTRLRLPFLPFACAVLYAALYVMNVPFLYLITGDLTVTECLLFAAVFESCIQCGLIRSNAHYAELFCVSAVRAQITDPEYNVRLSSDGARQVSREIMRQTEVAPALLEGGVRLSGARIRGEHVLWQDDVLELTRLMERLEDDREHLESRNTALGEAYRTERRRRRLVEQNRLYDRICKVCLSSKRRFGRCRTALRSCSPTGARGNSI